MTQKSDDAGFLTTWPLIALAIGSIALSSACCSPALAQSCGPAYTSEGPELVPCGPAFASDLDVRAEYLLWWTDGMDVPSLLTTSPLGTPRGQAGVLGQPNTSVLYGGAGLNGDVHSGGRFAVRGWFDPCRNLGFELAYTFLEQDTATHLADSSGDPILARPFVNANAGFQDAGLIAYPNVAEGSFAVNATTQFYTAEAMLTKMLFEECDQRVVLLLGYRHASLEDDLSITETMVSRDTATAGSTLNLFDQFTTKNTFNGPQLGMLAERRSRAWTLQFLTKLALGSVHSDVAIAGSTTATSATEATATTPNGFYALATNTGRYEQDSFGGMTELGLQLSCDFGCHWRASLGYSFLYWYYLARAGEQIDTTLAADAFPPAQGRINLHPQFPFTTTGFWAQGLNFGIEYRF
jgi:hypothetical protein